MTKSFLIDGWAVVVVEDDLLLMEGNASLILGEYDKAIEIYDRCIKINDRNAAAWNNQGVAICLRIEQKK